MERVADQSWSSSYTYQVSKHSAEMLSNLNNQRKNGGRFCDVILRVGDESFPAHKAVLAACSEYFESVFSCQAEDGGDSGGGGGGGGGAGGGGGGGGGGGNETKELEMHTISSKVFKDILDFAYTSKIVVRLECFPELMTAAKFLLMRSVIEICQEVIKQSNVQILVPPARPDLALFRAGAPDLGYPLDMSNGSGLLANGSVFPGAHDGEVNPRGASPQALAPLPGPAPQLSPQLLAGPFPGGGASGGGLAGKRGRGRPKKIANADPLLFGGPAIPKDVGFFPCGLCGKVFTDTSRLRNHEAQHGAAAAAAAASGGLHGLGGAVSQQQQQQQQQQPPPSVQGPPIGLGAAIGLGDNGLALQGLPDTARKRERTRRHVGCDICGKVFRDVYHLNRHKLSHSGEKPYACPVCGLRFKRKDRMSYHVRSHDGSVGKPYVCQSCGKGFSRPDHLNGHIKQVHTSERPHKCQTCNASFATRDRLRSHLACHEDKIPCQVCGKFLRAAYMTDHLKKHSEGPHNYCSICDKDGQDDLQKCPHQDDNSDSSFGELSDTGELKPRHKVEESLSFQCEATASTGGKMKNEPEKKHTCSECGNSFRSKSYLNKHIQKAHAPQKALGPAGTLGELAPSLNSPFSPQQNMSLLESFGFQIVQSAFASSLVDSEAGHSSMSLGGK